MKEYKALSLEKAYKLLNTGAIILIASKGNDNISNLTPIAWNTLVDYDPVTRMLFVCDKDHKTYSNIMETNRFVVVLPHVSQSEMVKKLGSVSGKNVNKIESVNIQTFKTNRYDFDIPAECISYLECKVYRVLDEGSVGIVFGEVENAMVDKEAFSDRLLSENDAGKTLHHLGGKKFMQPDDKII